MINPAIVNIQYIESAYAHLFNALDYLEAVHPDQLGIGQETIDDVLASIDAQIMAVRKIHETASKNLDASSKGETA